MDKELRDAILEMDIEDFEEDERFEEIGGTGSSRKVYLFNDQKHVVKVAFDAGWKQNKTEKTIWKKASSEQRKHLCPVVAISDSYEVLIAKFCQPLKQGDMPPKSLELRDLISTYGLGDTVKEDSWGRYRGRVVLLDYGLTSELYDEEYSADIPNDDE